MLSGNTLVPIRDPPAFTRKAIINTSINNLNFQQSAIANSQNFKAIEESRNSNFNGENNSGFTVEEPDDSSYYDTEHEAFCRKEKFIGSFNSLSSAFQNSIGVVERVSSKKIFIYLFKRKGRV